MHHTFLVVGGGAREHAIATALHKQHTHAQNTHTHTHVDILVYATNRNPALHALAKAYQIGKLDDAKAVAQFALQHKATHCVIGPEAPLDAAVADALLAVNVPTLGPTKMLAQIETSKGFALDLLSKHGVAGVPRFREFDSLDGARDFLEELGEGNYVVKADGLCGGKGVKVAGDHLASIDEALAYCAECLPRFVLCERLVGQEFSLLSLCDGETLVHLPPLQDHKRAYEGDKGPNTGGMGTYSCADGLLPFLSQARLDEARAMNVATAAALKAEFGEPYRGVLYGGFMLTARGVMLIEYNARFGDPECLNLLSLLAPSADFAAVCAAAAEGKLASAPTLPFLPLASVCKYAVPEGYPTAARKGFEVGLGSLASPQLAYLGSVDQPGGEGTPLVAAGSRTVGVVGLAPTLDEAEAAAEAEVGAVSGALFHRRDIGTAALVASRVRHMLSVQRTAAPAAPLRVGVLGSTRGSALAPVLRALASADLRGVELAICLSNKADAPILERAALHGIAAEHVPVRGRPRDEYDAVLTEKLEAAGVQLVLLVGYMRILSPSFVKRWSGRALNVHPSLLPAFAGGMDLEVHSAVLRARVPESGCTVHFVEEEVDMGAAVVQKRCPTSGCASPEDLKARVQALEAEALCEAVAKVAATLGADASYAPAAPGGAGGSISYASAGVSIDAGNALIDLIKPMAKSTRRAGSMGGLGGFGGLFDLKATGYADPILVSSTDGVGTKLIIAQAADRHDSIGIDLVGMVLNDLVVQGAEPLFFLDYFASGALQLEAASAVVRGIAQGCKECNCALVGGETAEMPGMYAPGHYDLAGFAVGAVERGAMLPRLGDIRAGDVLLGVPSSGVHSNGFSLVRKCVERAQLDWTSAAPFGDSKLSLADALLAPTKLYIRSCLPAARSGKVKALAHITGGGIVENLPRVLPDAVGARVDATAWTPPPVFKWLATVSKSGVDEMLRTFNCGIGMVLVVAAADAADVITMVERDGDACVAIGRLESRAAADVPQVVVERAESWGWPSC